MNIAADLADFAVTSRGDVSQMASITSGEERIFTIRCTFPPISDREASTLRGSIIVLVTLERK
jgi:hypothetical protein